MLCHRWTPCKPAHGRTDKLQSAETMQYYPRTIEHTLRQALADTPVVCLLGPRQCGKTTLAKYLDPERPYMSFDDDVLLAAANNDPRGFIAALPNAATLDEVQRVPELLPALKLSVDQDRSPGRFLLTGSANLLLLPTVNESLAGRMEIVCLHPFTESEKEQTSGTFLERVITNKLEPEIQGREAAPPKEVIRRVATGGYPEPMTRSLPRARQWHRQYLNSIIQPDVKTVANVRGERELARLLEVAALRTSTLLNASALGKELGLYRETVEHYLGVLEKLYLIRRLPAWHRNAAKRLVKTAKLHVIDSGLAAGLAEFLPEDWLPQQSFFGQLFESFIVQQIIAQASWTDTDLRFWHYRDKDKVEVDLVVTRGRKAWGIEAKSSSTVKKNDGRGLRRLADQCGTDFQTGILLYAGDETFNLGDKRLWAVPVKKLWEL